MTMAIDSVKRWIRCDCICPGRMHTPFADGFVATDDPGREADVRRPLAIEGGVHVA